MTENQRRFRCGLAVLLALVLFSAIFIFCRPQRPAQEEMSKLVLEPQVINFKNGVYYFPWTGDEYHRRLSTFKEENPNLELVAAEPEIGTSFGGAVGVTGHTVHFREKK
jgi:hypothetical protein